MKTYTVSVESKHLDIYSVKANSREEAIEKLKELEEATLEHSEFIENIEGTEEVVEDTVTL